MTRRRTFAVALWLASLATLLGLSFLAHTWPRFPGDLELSRLIQGMSFTGMRQAMGAVSFIGERPVALSILFGLSGLLWLTGRRRESLFLMATLVPDLMNIPLKDLVGRERPDPSLVQVVDPGASERSFPSGHAVHFVAFYGALIYLLPGLVRNHLTTVRILRWGMVLLILLAGISRVYLGLHWPSDVLSGYLDGALYLSAIVVLYRLAIGHRRQGPETAKLSAGPPDTGHGRG